MPDLLRELLQKSRSCRRFHQEQDIPSKKLLELLELTRLCPSAANLQPLRYVVVNNPEKNAAVFPLLKWAGYLKDWPGPAEGERPAAYLVICGDRKASTYLDWDAGIALQTILLGAAESGLAACAIAAFDKEGLRSLLQLDPGLDLVLVVALGQAAETIVIDPVRDGDIRYWRDDQQVHHVPKRSPGEILLALYE